MFKPSRVLSFACILVGAILGAHELYDPDLGWNLASGIWMFSEKQVPVIDPFGEAGVNWIDYCWFPQLIIAIFYKIGGFFGLLYLQILLAAVASALGIVLIEPYGYKRSEIFVAGALLLFLAPVFHVRPQLFSVILFQLFLIWRRGDRSTKELLLLSIIWVNTHVYWMLMVPVLAWDLLSKRGKMSEMPIAVIAGAISPYGIDNFIPVIQYATDHAYADSLIREFAPLFSVKGYLFPLVGITTLIAFRQANRDLPLILGFLLLALRQMKFTPLFGCLALKSPISRIKDKRNALLAKQVAICSLIATLIPGNTLRDREAEIITLVKPILNDQGTISNFFNEGGWLAFALQSPGQPVKTSVDGRTLVMGKERLTKLRAVMQGERSICDHLTDRQFALFQLGSKAFKLFEGEECSLEWNEIGHGNYYVLYKRSMG